MTDQRFESLLGVVIALIAIVPATLGAWWARKARDNSNEAKANSVNTLHEIQTNGGMKDPNPNLNDHIKYQTEMMEHHTKQFQELTQIVRNSVSRTDVVEEELRDLKRMVSERRRWLF